MKKTNALKTCNICGSTILIDDPIVFEFHERQCQEWSNQ